MKCPINFSLFLITYSTKLKIYIILVENYLKGIKCAIIYKD